MKRNMKLLLLGDENVGKTSLIYAFISEVTTEVVKTLKTVVLPPDMCLYSKDVFTEIIDTSIETDIRHEMNCSDLILLVYDTTNPNSVARLQCHWLPIIANHNNQIPVILVGNKIDKKELELNEDHQYTNVREILRAVTRVFPQVQMGIECSAYYDRNVKSVLSCAHKALLYPLSPLYHLQKKELQPKFEKAIKRIFRILDSDWDQKLSDSELSSLQQRVFQTELNSDDIKAIKEIILKELEEQHHDYITLAGFLTLQKKCIQLLKIQICWSILRYFHYDDKLDLIDHKEQLIVDQSLGEGIELSNLTYSFLEKIYTYFLKTEAEDSVLDRIFECAPAIPLEEFKDGDMSLENFVSCWTLYAFIDYQACYRSLHYIGFEQPIDATFKKTRGKTKYHDLLKLKQRKAVSILVVDNGEYTSYLNTIFTEAVEDAYTHRIAKLFSNKDKSRFLLLFRIKKRFMAKFVKEVKMLKRFDLIVSFQNSDEFVRDDLSQYSDQIPSHIMQRVMPNEKATQLFKNGEMIKLDLQNFPIKFKKEDYEDQFLTFVNEPFEDIELGFSAKKINLMKYEHEQMNKILVKVIGAAGVVALGVILWKRKFF